MDDMEQTEKWLTDLRSMGRKENTIRTYRNNIRQCLRELKMDGRSIDVDSMTVGDILFLWNTMDVKEDVRWSYLRTLANMAEYHTGRDIVKGANILRNRADRNRVFIDKEGFCRVFSMGDPFQRVILCLGAYMGLRRAEMVGIRDRDIMDGMVTIHGKGHGDEGHVVTLRVPDPVMDVISDYRRSDSRCGIRRDDHLLQVRDRRGDLHKASVSRISDSVRNLSIESGVRMTVHSLRRLYATTLYHDVGCDLQTMRSLMRHADVSTTLRCYVDVDVRKEQEASDRLVSIMDDLVEHID